MEIDPSVHHATLKPAEAHAERRPIVTQIVESVRPVGRGAEAMNAPFRGGTRLLTVHSFLSANAIRANDSMDDIDWCSSNNSTPCALKSISVPPAGHGDGRALLRPRQRDHYEVAASRDKDFVVIEGATHGIRPCTACERTPGQYGTASGTSSTTCSAGSTPASDRGVGGARISVNFRDQAAS